jgi:hypothetical protein
MIEIKKAELILLQNKVNAMCNSKVFKLTTNKVYLI